jgi:Ala-tRNA(Pro) deacylase
LLFFAQEAENSMNRVDRVLETDGLHGQILTHGDTWTAGGIAEAIHVPTFEVAKAVVVRDADGRYLMAVVPASCRLDLVALSKASGHRGLTLASEAEVADLFPDCELGAPPPLGTLYNIPTFLDGCLCDVERVYLSSGRRQETVALSVADYFEVARPSVGSFCLHREAPIGVA